MSAVVGDELRGLRAAVKQQPHVGEAEADAARNGLRRVAADKEAVLHVEGERVISLSLAQSRRVTEEAVLVGRGVVQQRELRHGQVLHLVDDDLVQRRVAPRLRLEVEDLSESTRLVDGEPVRTAATVAELAGAPGRTRRTGRSSSSS